MNVLRDLEQLAQRSVNTRTNSTKLTTQFLPVCKNGALIMPDNYKTLQNAQAEVVRNVQWRLVFCR